jgi:hypothetical protein
MPVDHSEFKIIKLCDATTPLLFGDGLAVDPNNPNSEIDGRDFLIWQRGSATDDKVGLPAVQTDDGLLLPAVRMDDGEAGIKDGTSNTVMIGEVVQPAPTGRTDGVFTVVLPGLPTGDEVLIAFESGDMRNGADYSGTHLLYQDVFVPTAPVAMEAVTIAHEGFLLV